MQETWVRSLGREDHLEKEMATYVSVLACPEFHGQRNLVDYSPWGHKELDMSGAYNRMGKQALEKVTQIYNCPLLSYVFTFPGFSYL